LFENRPSFNLQGRRISQARNQHEAGSKQRLAGLKKMAHNKYEFELHSVTFPYRKQKLRVQSPCCNGNFSAFAVQRVV
jgi:hypothetical protein